MTICEGHIVCRLRQTTAKDKWLLWLIAAVNCGRAVVVVSGHKRWEAAVVV